jgi:hypothetical protein
MAAGAASWLWDKRGDAGAQRVFKGARCTLVTHRDCAVTARPARAQFRCRRAFFKSHRHDVIPW